MVRLLCQSKLEYMPITKLEVLLHYRKEPDCAVRYWTFSSLLRKNAFQGLRAIEYCQLALPLITAASDSIASWLSG